MYCSLPRRYKYVLFSCPVLFVEFEQRIPVEFHLRSLSILLEKISLTVTRKLRIMKCFAMFSVLAAATTSLAAVQTVSYDTGYDDASRSLTVVACSDGANGIITSMIADVLRQGEVGTDLFVLEYGYKTQGAIPTFPNIGGSGDISGYNDPQCGTCYKVTYKGKSIFVLGIDRAAAGINMSKKAMDTLTGGQAVALGRINANVVKVGVGTYSPNTSHLQDILSNTG